MAAEKTGNINEDIVTAEEVSTLLKKKSKQGVIIMIISALFMFAFIFMIQGIAISYQLQSLNMARLESAKTEYQENVEQERKSRTAFDEQYSARLQMMAYMYDHTTNVTEAWARLSQSEDYKDVGTVLLLNSTGDSMDVVVNVQELKLSDLKPVMSVMDKDEYTYIDPVTIHTENGNSIRLFAEKLTNGISLVIGVDTADLELEVTKTASISRTLSGLNNGDSGYVSAIDLSTNQVIYDINEENIGKDALECDFSEESLKDGYRGFIIRNRMVTTANTSVQSNSNNVITANTAVENGIALVSLTPVDNLSVNRVMTMVVTSIVYAAISGLIISLAMILRNDEFTKFEKPRFMKWGRRKNKKTGKKEQNYLNTTIFKKMLPVVIGGVVVIYIVATFLQSVYLLSDVSTETTKIMSEIQNILDDNEKTRDYVKSNEENQYISKANVISQMLMDNPDWIFNNSIYDENVHEVPVDVNKEGKQTGLDAYGQTLHSSANNEQLEWLVKINSIKDIYVFDENGRVVSTSADFWNFELSEDENSQSYPFWQILNGTKMNFAQDAGYDEVGTYSEYVGTTYYYYTYQDGSGKTQYTDLTAYESQSETAYQGPKIERHLGLVQIAVDPEKYAAILKTTDISHVFKNYHVSYSGFLTAFDKSDDPVLVYSPKSTSIGKTFSQLGGSDGEVFNNTGGVNNSILSINGVRYYQGFGEISDYYIGTAIPTTELFSVRDTVSNSLLFLSMFEFMMLVLTVSYTDAEEYSMYHQAMKQHDEFKGQPDEEYTLPLTEEKKQNRNRIFQKISPTDPNWSEKTPSQKFAVLLRLYAMVLAVILFLDIILARAHLIELPLDNYIMTSNWSRNFNFISATRSTAFLFLAIVGANLLSQIILMICRPLGSRATTIGRLSASVLRYGVVLFAIFYGLYMIGLNASNLLASAGIISVVVGLGAQSVIGDILAGIFIVFEGEFHVGDIVTIDGFTGTVLDVGLRTTKIRDSGGNIKIYDNTDISGVLNLSENPSRAEVKIPINHDEDLERVEKLISSEIKTLRQKNHDMLDDATYQGVTAMTRYSVELTITAPCYEKKKDDVAKFIRHDLYMMLKKNGVNWVNDDIEKDDLT